MYRIVINKIKIKLRKGKLNKDYNITTTVLHYGRMTHSLTDIFNKGLPKNL